MLLAFGAFAFALGCLPLGTRGLLRFLGGLFIGIDLRGLPGSGFVSTGCLCRLSLAGLFSGCLLLLLTSGFAAGFMVIGLLLCGFSSILADHLLLLLTTGFLTGFRATLLSVSGLLLLLMTTVFLTGFRAALLGVSGLLPGSFAATLTGSLLLFTAILTVFLAGLLGFGSLLLRGFAAAFAGSLLLLRLCTALLSGFLGIGCPLFIGLA
ncbi:MAG: hypothetical protein MR333_03900 [Porphyromonadaceae bacterium]|nr:hypothetical protein [Porphyromonadaceae bacterium]